MVMGDRTNPVFSVGTAVDPITGAATPGPESSDSIVLATVINAQNLNPLGPSAATAGSTASISVNGRATLDIFITANTLNQALAVYASNDGTNWVLLGGQCLVNQGTGLMVANSIPAAATGMWTLSVADFSYVRISTPNTALTGSATVTLAASSTVSVVSIDNVILATTPGSPTTAWQVSVTDIVNTQTLLKAAAGAGLRNYITDLIVANSSASAELVTIQDGNTTLAVVNVPAGTTLVLSPRTPWKGTANTAVNVLAGTALSTIYVSATGYTAA
jgi:hypothetical protein